MRRILYVSIAAFMVSALYGCGQINGSRGNEADVQAIRKLFSDFCEAHKYNDGAKLSEFYTDDAMLMPPDEPIISGKAAIASRYQQDLDKFTVVLITNSDEIEVSGNLGYVRGTFTIRLTPKSEGEKIEISFKALSILRKDTDGSWKLYCDIWNSDASLPPKPNDLTIAPPHQFELIPAENPKKVSEGIYQVGWIRVSLPGDESHVQMIPVQMDEPDANWMQWGLNRQDINFDGYLDIGVCQHGGAKWGRLHWCLYNPQKMEFYTNSLTKELSKLICADFKTDPTTKTIKITRFLDADLTEYSYQISDNHLSLCGLRQLDKEESKVGLTVATVCMNVKTDTAANLKTFAEYIKQASRKGAQLIVFPEIALQQNPGWLARQVSEDEMAYVHRTAEPIPGPSTAAITELAKQHKIYIIFGMTEKSENDELYNASVLLGPDGVIGKYRKQHLFTDKRRGGNEELFWKPGTEMGLFETPFGKIGLITCIEMEDHFGGELTDAGADILVTTTAWRGDVNKAVVLYERYTKSNAFESNLWHIVSNQVGQSGHVTGYGHSRVVHPSGEIVADTGSEERMTIVRINGMEYTVLE